MADELERDHPFSRLSAENESELLDCDFAIFLTSLDSAASALLGYAQEEQEMFEGKEVETEPSQSSCTAYERVIGDYGSEKEIFLAINPQLERAFLSSNLDVEVEKEWKKQFFSRIHRFQHTSYADIEGMLKMAMRTCPLCKR